MDSPDRRSSLRNAAMSAGATTGLTAFPPAIQHALAGEAFHETGTLRDVKHVVILMQENRAFNHYFGTMKGVRGFGDRFTAALALALWGSACTWAPVRTPAGVADPPG